MQQQTPEWREARAGHFTASRFGDVIAFRKDGKPSQARTDYIWQVVAEVLSGQPAPSVSAPALRWGTDVESGAISSYEAEKGVIVERAGFVEHPRIPYVGCSPDFLVGTAGMGQVKCPHSSAIHCGTLMAKTIPDEHIPQVQGELWVTGREWSDFVSFDPRLPPDLRLYVYRVEADPKYHAMLEEACAKAWAEVQKHISDLNNLKVAA